MTPQQRANEMLANDQDFPSETQRTAEYETELLNRYRTGQFLTETDKCEARAILRRQKRDAAAPNYMKRLAEKEASA